MKTYFDFEFVLDDGERVRRFGFTLPSITIEQEQETGLYDTMIDFCGDDAEEYGVHDYFGSEGSDIRSMGYSSYEVAEENIDVLMEKWRDFFVEFFGEDKVGAVFELPAGEPDLENDYSVLSGQGGPAPSLPDMEPV